MTYKIKQRRSGINIHSSNFSFIFGCSPNAGIAASTEFVEDVINLFLTNFDAEYGSIVIPDVYSNVVSGDAQFEIVTSVLAKKLSLKRQDNIIGHKRMIYAIDREDRTREPMRRLLIDFFKKHLGFSKNDIFFIDRNEFEQIKEVW